MLLDIKNILAQRKHMTLSDLAIHFEADPHALEPMLETLIHKGIVRKIKLAHARCGGCSQCASCPAAADGEMTIYESPAP